MEIEKSALDQQLEPLFNKEKVARQENNSSKLEELLTQIATLIYQQKDYSLLFSTIELLCKKRGQSKKAQVNLVQQCMKWVQETQNQEKKIEFLECLKRVCDKKIYLEVEYARCCLILVKNKETEEQINEAAKIMQEVQVETYGSMDRREKLEFILYQMKIMIKKKDYVRLLIVSNKIQRKNLEDKEIYDLKVQFYAYLVEYYVHMSEYINAANAYQKIFDSYRDQPEFYQNMPSKTLDFNFNAEKENTFQNFVVYSCLATYSPEQQTTLNILKKTYQNELERNPNLMVLVDKILDTELVNNSYEFYKLDQYLPFLSQTEHHQQHKLDIVKQLLQHNIRIIERYYTKISIKRISEFLNIPQQQTEDHICEMINIKQIKGKIDRGSGIVKFRLIESENDQLDKWSRDVNQVLELIDQTCNLIKRE